MVGSWSLDPPVPSSTDHVKSWFNLLVAGPFVCIAVNCNQDACTVGTSISFRQMFTRRVQVALIQVALVQGTLVVGHFCTAETEHAREAAHVNMLGTTKAHSALMMHGTSATSQAAMHTPVAISRSRHATACRQLCAFCIVSAHDITTWPPLYSWPTTPRHAACIRATSRHISTAFVCTFVQSGMPPIL